MFKRIKEFLRFKKETEKVFKPLKTKIYIGSIVYGTPYFNPIGFVKSIVYIRKLKRGSKGTYLNLPMVRRSKDIIVKDYYITWGSPIKIHFNGLGWKDKYDTPRFEWNPCFSIFFFYWQFVIIWLPPLSNLDNYWEQVLWWYYYSNKDVEKAEKTWGWVDGKTKKSTWNNENTLST